VHPLYPIILHIAEEVPNEIWVNKLNIVSGVVGNSGGSI
jgi:hypothetical protein